MVGEEEVLAEELEDEELHYLLMTVRAPTVPSVPSHDLPATCATTVLPDELLLLEVFARLPLLTIFLLRLLSKSWRASLTSASFLAAWSRHAAASGQRWLVVGDVRYDAPGNMPSDPKLLAFCPSHPGHAWLPLPIHSPGPRILPRPLYPDLMSYELIADSAGGLVCAIARHDDFQPQKAANEVMRQPCPHWSYRGYRFTIVVFNPLTGQTRALPAPSFLFLDPVRAVLTMLAASAPSPHYNVILCRTRDDGSCYYSGGMLIFNSQTNLWSSIPSSSSSNTRAGISILQADLFEWDEKESLISGYCVYSDTWCKVPGPPSLEPLPANAISAQLITIHKGRLLFVRPICEGYFATGFSVWEFQPAVQGSPDITTTCSPWVLLARTPVHLQEPIGGPKYDEEEEEEEFNHEEEEFDQEIDQEEEEFDQEEEEFDQEEEEDPLADYRIICSGSLLCLVIAEFRNKVVDYAEYHFILSSLTYDLDEHSWSRLPPVDDREDLGWLFTGGFSFQPSFVATV